MGKNMTDIVNEMVGDIFRNDDEKREIIGDYPGEFKQFLEKIYEIDRPDESISKWSVNELTDTTYSEFKRTIKELSRTCGFWFIKVSTPVKKTTKKSVNSSWLLGCRINKEDKKAKAERETKIYQKILKMEYYFRLRILLFETAKMQNPNIEDKKYYDKLWRIKRLYEKEYERCTKQLKELKKNTSLTVGSRLYSSPYKKNYTIEEMEEEMKCLEDKKETALQEKDFKTFITTSKELHSVLTLLAHEYTNVEDLKNVKEKLQHTFIGYIYSYFPNSFFFHSYLKITLETGAETFPQDFFLEEKQEEIYGYCRKKYNENPRQDIKDLISEAEQ